MAAGNASKLALGKPLLSTAPAKRPQNVICAPIWLNLVA